MVRMRPWQIWLVVSCALIGTALGYGLSADKGVVGASLIGVLGMLGGTAVGFILIYNPAELFAALLRLLAKSVS